jgi:apolipoprotein N-acyltransferase
MKTSKIAFYYLPIVSGILIGTSYIPSIPWASLFALLPLWIFWIQINEGASPESKNKSNTALVKQVIIGGWITQFVLTCIGFNWIALTAHDFGHFPWPLAMITLFLFCATAGLDLPLTGFVWMFLTKKLGLKPKDHSSLLLLPLLTAAFKNLIPSIFPWNYGYTWLWVHLPIAQVSELFGFQGLSTLVIFMNFGFLVFYMNRINNKSIAKKYLTITATAFVTLNAVGYFLVNSTPPPDQNAHVLITQANIGNIEKMYGEKGLNFRSFILSRYSTLTTSAFSALTNSEKVDFIVWPETAYPYDLDQRTWSSNDLKPASNNGQIVYPISAQPLFELTKSLNTTLITGGYGYAPSDGKLTNTFFIIEPNARIQPDPYYKTILLAYGEYIPGATLFPILKDWIPAGDFSIGLGPIVKTVISKSGKNILIGPQICYESLFSSFAKKLADQGTEIFVNLTNDSWYGTWQEPHQHMTMTAARAIEYRRPIIRSTNTGISTVALANGRILEQSPSNVEWTGYYNIPYLSNPTPTFYQKLPWLMDALIIFTLLLLILTRVWRKKQIIQTK